MIITVYLSNPADWSKPHINWKASLHRRRTDLLASMDRRDDYRITNFEDMISLKDLWTYQSTKWNLSGRKLVSPTFFVSHECNCLVEMLSNNDNAVKATSLVWNGIHCLSPAHPHCAFLIFTHYWELLLVHVKTIQYCIKSWIECLRLILPLVYVC